MSSSHELRCCMRKMECQLCGKVYKRAESKLTLCSDCRTEPMVKEARILRVNLSLAQTHDLPATLTLPQWIATLDYFAWTCAYCQEQPYKLMEHFDAIPNVGSCALPVLSKRAKQRPIRLRSTSETLFAERTRMQRETVLRRLPTRVSGQWLQLLSTKSAEEPGNWTGR